MNLIRLIILNILICCLCLCFMPRITKQKEPQEINSLRLLKTSQMNTVGLHPLYLPTAGEAKAERPRIRRIGLSPEQYASSPGKLCQTDVNVVLAKDPIIYSSDQNLKYSTDVLDKADTRECNSDNSDKDNHANKPQHELLYSLVQAEAGNQDLDGCRLVADVVLNRMASEKFPNTMEEVIYAPGQFSVVRNGALAKAVPSEKVIQAVDMELSNTRLDSTVLYFNNSNNGGWKYGGHYFK